MKAPTGKVTNRQIANGRELFMRPRLLLISLTVAVLASFSTADAAKDHKSRKICGIVARITLMDSSIPRDGKLRIRLLLENQSDVTADFRYYGGAFLQHIRIFTEAQKPVRIRPDAPFLEPAADRITLKPGEKVETEVSVVPSQRYELPPAKYRLQFYYDLRLIADEHCAAEYRKRHRGENWVVWDSKRYLFIVSR